MQILLPHGQGVVEEPPLRNAHVLQELGYPVLFSIPYHVTCLAISRVISLGCPTLRNASAILLNSAKQAVSLFKTAASHYCISPSKLR